ncbi:MAG: T9SS type A sorting domain-containing protein [Candidatus Marinimicrobia bacterium]|nr:T9SS type A sorting domain-containing protein [Candidatus Neomarinimicrobiota bacterium]
MKWIISMIIVLVSVCTVTATVINVPTDVATIQGGIDTATDGDTVLVSPGTYVENIDFEGNNILVKSLAGPMNTTIDGNQSGSVVLLISGEDERAVLDGFTITNGSGWDNGDEIVGGGIACREGSSPTLRNLIISNNTALGGDDPAGGGITIAQNSNPSLENIEIYGNESKWGGGLAIAMDSNPTIKNVEIYNNDATTTGGGVYIGVESEPFFQSVYVHNNRATYYGGGFFIHNLSRPTLNKVTVTNNRATSGGGGMILNDGSYVKIVNSIFWSNIPDQIKNNSDTQYRPDTLNIAYSCVMSGESEIDPGIGSVNWIENNSSEDPGFGDEPGLDPSSGCIDAGTAYYEYDGEVWIDMDENEYTDLAPDVGAWEAPRTYDVPGDYVTIQEAIDASIDGDIVMVDVGTYVENINFSGKNITVKSLGGPDYTIIDGNQNGATVLFLSGETDKAVFDGFTVTNGNGHLNLDGDYVGGGISVRFTSAPTLKHLIVSGNATLASLGSAGSAGGGIGIGAFSNPVLEDIIIKDNHSTWGGGLSIYSSSPTLKNVEIYDNTVPQGGGGVYIGQESSPYLERVYVHDNAALAGGGFFLHDHVTPIFNKVTVIGNSGTNGGGGMLTNDGSTPKIINSIFYANAPDQFYCMSFDPEAQNAADTVSIAYSDVMGGIAGMHLGIGRVNWIEGNITSSPRFQDGNHLSPISPCIDAGTASFSFEGETWIDMNSDEYVGSAPDMGSYEVPGPPQALLVPQNFNTIQLAIEAALDGDTVRVDDGTYYENIDFLGKNIAVVSVNGPEATIIDGGNLNSTVFIMNQEETAILDGFTITNGLGWVNPDGYSVGGGIIVRYGSTPTLKNLIVENNTALGDTSMGGGIMCAYNANALIEDVIIRANTADYAGGFMAYESSPTLRRVKISDNTARVTGGGLTLWTSDALVEQSVIFNNQARYMAGGVWIHLGGNPTLDRVTIADNKTTSNVGHAAGGLGLSTGANLVLINSIVWYNTNRGIVTNNIEFYPSTAPVLINVLYSDVQGGEAGIITNGNGTVIWGDNNIVDNPLFVDRPSYDYNLLAGSPCISAGEDGVDMGAGSFCMTLAVDPALALIPQQFVLYQNFPNPFNPSTSINFNLPADGQVSLVIYDLNGRMVNTLIDGEKASGYHSLNWLALDLQGKPLGTGIYLYEMKFTDAQGRHFRDVRKLTLLK